MLPYSAGVCSETESTDPWERFRYYGDGSHINTQITGPAANEEKTRDLCTLILPVHTLEQEALDSGLVLARGAN